MVVLSVLWAGLATVLVLSERGSAYADTDETLALATPIWLCSLTGLGLALWALVRGGSRYRLLGGFSAVLTALCAPIVALAPFDQTPPWDGGTVRWWALTVANVAVLAAAAATLLRRSAPTPP